MSRNILIMAAVALVAAAGGYFLARALSPAGGQELVMPGIEAASPPSFENLQGQRRPDFTLQDVNGNPVSASDFDGRVWLANFWATWCAPCVEEMPMLSDLQRAYTGQGVTILGIALDDPDRAREFAESLALSYPILVGQLDVVMTGRSYGNTTGMLPFSALIDADGIIQWTHLGALDRAELESRIQALR
jgi:peroxiredoxin